MFATSVRQVSYNVRHVSYNCPASVLRTFTRTSVREYRTVVSDTTPDAKPWSRWVAIGSATATSSTRVAIGSDSLQCTTASDMPSAPEAHFMTQHLEKPAPAQRTVAINCNGETPDCTGHFFLNPASGTSLKGVPTEFP